MSEDEELDADMDKLESLGVLRWFQCLSWRVPECEVVLVGTKCDKQSREDVRELAGRMERACKRWQGDGGSHFRITVEDGVALTSCWPPSERTSDSTNDGVGSAGQGALTNTMGTGGRRREMWPFDWGTRTDDNTHVSLLRRITHNRAGVPRGVKVTIPLGWDISLAVVEALSVGR